MKNGQNANYVLLASSQMIDEKANQNGHKKPSKEALLNAKMDNSSNWILRALSLINLALFNVQYFDY